MEYLSLFGFSKDKVQVKLSPGFADLTFFEKDPI